MDEKIVAKLLDFTINDEITWVLNPPTGTVYVTSLVVPTTPNSTTRVISFDAATNILTVDTVSATLSGPHSTFLLQAITKQLVRLQTATMIAPITQIAGLLGVQ